MKDLAWDKVVPVIFYSLLTLIGGYISYTLRDLTSNVYQLNIQMGTVVERLATTSKENESLKIRQDEQGRMLYDINGRVLVLERTK